MRSMKMVRVQSAARNTVPLPLNALDGPSAEQEAYRKYYTGCLQAIGYQPAQLPYPSMDEAERRPEPSAARNRKGNCPCRLDGGCQ